MPYKPLAIANYFIDCAHRDGERIDQLKLQKLVYFAHGWNLAVYGDPLITEQIEAWKYGPVLPSLWKAYRIWGAGSIMEKGDGYGIRELDLPEVEPEDMRTKRLLDRIWELYGGYSGVQLSQMTHEPGTPWAETRKGKIPNQLIQSHFFRLAGDSSPEMAGA